VRQVAALLALVVLTGCASVGGPVLDANGNAATLKQAQELRRADRAEQAAAIVQRALLTTSPGDVALQGELARDLVYSDPRRALEILAQAFDPAAPDPKLLMVGGVASDVLGDHVAAQRFYADALKIAPNDPAILANVEASRRMIAAEAPQNKKVAATSMPKRPAKRASVVPTASPSVISAPEVTPSPTFADRWRLL
jgi:Flp pilus assembly protein TadD